jgi:hypothetical protein
MSNSPFLPALRTGSRASSLLQGDAFAANPLNATNTVGAYEQREAAIGCAAVVNDAGFTNFCQRCALDRGTATLLQGHALTPNPLNATNPVGAYEQREAAIGYAAVVNDVEFTIFASAAHWIASKLTPTRGRVCRKSIERQKSC